MKRCMVLLATTLLALNVSAGEDIVYQHIDLNSMHPQVEIFTEQGTHYYLDDEQNEPPLVEEQVVDRKAARWEILSW